MVLHVVVPKDAKYKRELRESIAKKRRQLIIYLFYFIYFFFWGGGWGKFIFEINILGMNQKAGRCNSDAWKLKNRFEDVILSAHLWRCIAPISSALGDKKFLQLCFQRVSYHIMNTSNSNRLYSANSIRDISERLLANVLGHRSPAHLFQEYLKMSGGLWKVNWDVLELGD